MKPNKHKCLQILDHTKKPKFNTFKNQWISIVLFNEFVNPLNFIIQYIKLIQNWIIWKSKSETQLYNFIDKSSNENVTILGKTELQCTLWNT